jgi:hypothetical protein
MNPLRTRIDALRSERLSIIIQKDELMQAGDTSAYEVADEEYKRLGKQIFTLMSMLTFRDVDNVTEQDVYNWLADT